MVPSYRWLLERSWKPENIIPSAVMGRQLTVEAAKSVQSGIISGLTMPIQLRSTDGGDHWQRRLRDDSGKLQQRHSLPVWFNTDVPCHRCITQPPENLGQTAGWNSRARVTDAIDRATAEA